MIKENGSISVNTTDIFPIIKKWLYSDKDIFLREMISNASDAITKLKRLVSLGEARLNEDERFEIRVVLDKKKKTIRIIDNGIGMTADEVKKYINQVAFSGAEEFLKKYQAQKDEASQIIGHFGLGFYSAFMVSDKVEIDTRSYIEDAEPVKWSCSGGIEYEMGPSDRTERGTTITLHIASDSKEFLDKYKLRQILEKYCAFLPTEIFLEDVEEKEKDDKPINDTDPLWLKQPSDCTEEEYKEFYRKVFLDFQDPLFWIHLNVDYPFRLKGILYFPRLRNEFETLEGRIKLYNNQVFVADNIKEVIPEFLLLLKGVIDCPDLPLNVSRSFLQNDGYVRKISDHIAKKVADKLTGMFKTERENFNKYWDDINPFIKYGCMRDDKFYGRMKDILIFKNTDGEYTLLKDYLNRNSDKHKNQVFYITDEKQQAQYIRMFKEYGLEALYMTSEIDSAFINFLEMKESGLKFNRVDSDISDVIKDKDSKAKDSKEAKETLEKLFKEALGKEDLKVEIEALKAEDTPAVILLAEQSRRMQEFSRRFGAGFSFGDIPAEESLVLNINNRLINKLVEYGDREDKKEDTALICRHVYDLAQISLRPLEPEAMTEFIRRSNLILSRLAGAES
ncbi:MAG TPA: molecular chaperone HtpG [Candidatus Atribacteria bacterium]|nr:molecular chaperone HtpG [Candidatus Atribacteria bacterium]